MDQIIIIVETSGGVVQCVRTNIDKKIKIEIVDFDDLSDTEANKKYVELEEKFPNIIY